MQSKAFVSPGIVLQWAMPLPGLIQLVAATLGLAVECCISWQELGAASMGPKGREAADTACHLQAAPISASTGAMRASWDHTASTYNDFVTGANVMAPARDRILAIVTTFAEEHTGERLWLFPHPLMLVWGVACWTRHQLQGGCGFN